MSHEPSFKGTREVYRAGPHVVLRKARVEDGAPVVLKTVSRAHPDAASATLRLRLEHALLAGLDLDGAARVLSLTELEGEATLVLEDAGAPGFEESTSTGGRSTPEVFLKMAIELADVVDGAP